MFEFLNTTLGHGLIIGLGLPLDIYLVVMSIIQLNKPLTKQDKDFAKISQKSINEWLGIK